MSRQSAEPPNSQPPRHEALAHLALAAKAAATGTADGVILRALPYRPSLILRGESDDGFFQAACRAALGFDLPLAPNHAVSGDGFAALWLGPSEWLILGQNGRDRLTEHLSGCRHALICNGDGQQIIALSGFQAGAVLAKLCPLDLERVLAQFPKGATLEAVKRLYQGRCARSVLAGIAMTVWQPAHGIYHVHVGRSYADYAWRVLADAALEFGLAIQAEDVAGSEGANK